MGVESWLLEPVPLAKKAGLERGDSEERKSSNSNDY